MLGGGEFHSHRRNWSKGGASTGSGRGGVGGGGGGSGREREAGGHLFFFRRGWRVKSVCDSVLQNFHPLLHI